MTIQDFPMDPSTPSQRQVLEYVRQKHQDGQRGMVWWTGGVRAGKSFGACIAMLEHQRHRQGKVYMVLAYTAGQAMTVFGNALESIAADMGYETKLNRGAANPRLVVKETGNEFLFRGADKAGRDKAIQGLTLDGLIVDEVPNLYRDTVHQAEARVSGLGGLRIYTSNKTSPYHWTTKYYVNRIKEGVIDGLMVDCTMADNPHIDPDFQAERAGEFTGNTLTRFISNEYTLDHPPIYRPVIGRQDESDLNMGLFTIINSHHLGQEVITGELYPSHVQVCQALTLPHETTVEIPHDSMVLLNGAQTLMARSLRRGGFSVRGYQDGFQVARMNLLIEACRREVLWIDLDAVGLMEAVNSYHLPGNYEYPCMLAFEALAHLVRPYVS